ncbi:hypothetical protein ACJIZ3_019903 [Penstemon smallii]|uniref:Uncharacterized protein n=1 Tax=Penstemon smallii TaxID=265156 RepID=A0ABD3T3C9_9LAMI
MDDDEIEVTEEKDGHDHREKLRKWAATCVVTYADYAAFLCSFITCSNYENESSLEESDYERQRRGLIRDTAHSSVEEQVAKFLIIKFNFRRSTETISRHFHQVLRAIIYFEDIFLKQPNVDEFACTFYLMFTYVLPGWEWSTSDPRILSDVLTREIDRLIIPQSKKFDQFNSSP